jgi:hypothetical protein
VALVTGIVEIQPIGNRLLGFPLPLAPNRKAGKIRSASVRNRHRDQHRIHAGIGNNA